MKTYNATLDIDAIRELGDCLEENDFSQDDFNELYSAALAGEEVQVVLAVGEEGDEPEECYFDVTLRNGEEFSALSGIYLEIDFED